MTSCVVVSEGVMVVVDISVTSFDVDAPVVVEAPGVDDAIDSVVLWLVITVVGSSVPSVGVTTFVTVVSSSLVVDVGDIVTTDVVDSSSVVAGCSEEVTTGRVVLNVVC